MDPEPKLRALIVSPSASHPRDYGNRNRVWQTTRFLQQLGYDITFILYPFESDWEQSMPTSYADMKRQWNDVVLIPPSLPLHQRARGEHHEIDEWWDPQIGTYLEWRLRRQFFDLMFVNYTFFSKAFTYAPKHTTKILDTHDLFTGRKEMLADNGVEPEFFYTTAEQEAVAFDRADIILAIKNSEQEIIEKATKKMVLSLPFYPVQAPANSDGNGSTGRWSLPTAEQELVVGFIGARNSINIVNMKLFLTEMKRLFAIYTPNLRIIVAGNVCAGLWSDNPAVRLLGAIEEVADFYRQVDVIVTPLGFSTGIKIKVGEALSFGKPVISTANGFDGYLSFDPYHCLPDISSVCHALIKVAYDRPRLAQLAERTAMTARMAELGTEASLQRLQRVLRGTTRRILFITDRPFWLRDTLWHERLYQWYELLSYLAPITCLVVGNPGSSLPNERDAPGSFVRVTGGPTGDQLIRGATDAISSFCDIAKVHCVVSVRIELLAPILNCPESHTLSFDSWGDADLPFEKQTPAVVTGADLVLRPVSGEPISLLTMPLRYRPPKLTHWGSDTPTPHFIVVLCSVDRGQEIELDFILARLKLMGLRVTVIGRGEAAVDVTDDEFLTWATTVSRVQGAILIGNDVKMRRLYHSAFTYLQIPCEQVALERFPSLYTDAQGRTHLVQSVPQLVECLLTGGRAASPKEAHDAGWSRVWRFLEAA